MSPTSTGNMGKQNRPTKRSAWETVKWLRNCSCMWVITTTIIFQDHIAFLTKNIVKSVALVSLCWYGSWQDLNFLVPQNFCLLVSFLARFPPSYTHHFGPNIALLKCCYFSCRGAATRGKDARGEVLSTSGASSVSKSCKVAWFTLSD